MLIGRLLGVGGVGRTWTSVVRSVVRSVVGSVVGLAGKREKVFAVGDEYGSECEEDLLELEGLDLGDG